MCHDEMYAEIKHSPFVSIMLDDTSDISGLMQQVSVFCYKLIRTMHNRVWGF